MTIEERVQRGAAILDEHRPGWWYEIGTEFLDVRSCSSCVIGQLSDCADNAGAFQLAAMSITGLPVQRQSLDLLRDAGFAASEEAIYRGSGATHDEYVALTEVWRDLIEARRAAESAALTKPQPIPA